MAKRAAARTGGKLTTAEKLHAALRAQGAALPLAPTTVYGKSRSSTQARLPFTKPKAHARLSGRIKRFRALKEPSEKDELRVLGALDAAEEEGALSKEDRVLAESLRAKLYPVIREDMRSNPSEMDRRDLYLAVGGAGMGVASGVAGKLTKSDDIARFAKAIAAKEKIPVGEISSLGKGWLSHVFGPSGYSLTTKNIQTVPSEAVALHELGHAKDFGKATKLRKALHAGVGDVPVVGRLLKKMLPAGVTHIPMVPMALAAPLLSNTVREALKSEDKGALRAKLVEAIEKHPWSIGVGASLPVLKREAKASAFALKQLAKLRGGPGVLKGLAALAPAFGTYAVGSALAGAVTDRAVRYQEKMERARARGMKRLAELEGKK